MYVNKILKFKELFFFHCGHFHGHGCKLPHKKKMENKRKEGIRRKIETDATRKQVEKNGKESEPLEV
jgi:hypothetical protein